MSTVGPIVQGRFRVTGVRAVGGLVSRMSNREHSILVVDDNPAQAKLLREAFAECSPAIHVSVLTRSEDILDYVYRKGKYSDAKRPDLIILDYRMPLDGGRALAELKGDPDTQCIPILVLTGSDNPNDVDDIYRRHANACFLRPMDLDSSFKLVRGIAEHWLTHVMLPPPIPHSHSQVES